MKCYEHQYHYQPAMKYNHASSLLASQESIRPVLLLTNPVRVIDIFIYLRFNSRENIHTRVHNGPNSLEYAASEKI